MNLCKNNKTRTHRIHRIVAETFLENLEKFSQVNHIDEDKSNNRVDNLEWCTAKYNVNYGIRNTKAMLSRGSPVRCVETNMIYPSAREAGRQTNIYASSINRCCNNDYGFKTAGGYHWERVYKCEKIK